ncbi:MAG: Hpt domain-containing protein [SAR324 cluster bacterium]|nr:Hpt domain-containing protein [SAR324 cluster bacterium]
MNNPSKQKYYQQIANKKRDFPALIIISENSCVVYTHCGTGPKYEEVFKEFESFHEQNLGGSLLASLSENDRTALQNWIDILYDETYVELMMPEDIVKLCPSFSLTWTDGQNYEVRFEAIKTEVIYEYVLVWLEPHGHTQQQQLASDIIELMGELRAAPREVINNLREYLPEVNTNINFASYADIEDSEELLHQLSRHLHAAKGTTFFLGFSTLGNACHGAESKLGELRGTWQLSDGLQPIRDVLSQLQLLLNLAEGISTKVYNSSAESEEEEMSVSRSDYYEILGNAALIYEEWKHLFEKEEKLVLLIDQLYHGLIHLDAVPITTLFERLNSSTAQLSKELDKSVEFSVGSNSPTVHLPHRVLDGLWNALYQVLKNAIDHGIEDPPTRAKCNKSPVGQIIFTVNVIDELLVLQLHDDGRGINPQDIIRTAVERGVISKEKAKQLEGFDSTDEIYQLLFSPGFSTQKVVTTISGRGVGTDVIREEIEEYSGQISIVSEVGQWTEFILRVPIAPNHIVVE